MYGWVSHTGTRRLTRCSYWTGAAGLRIGSMTPVTNPEFAIYRVLERKAPRTLHAPPNNNSHGWDLRSHRELLTHLSVYTALSMRIQKQPSHSSIRISSKRITTSNLETHSRIWQNLDVELLQNHWTCITNLASPEHNEREQSHETPTRSSLQQ